MRNISVRLTDSALRYATLHGLRSEVEKLALGAECLTGDLVSIEAGERAHDFIVTSRRWSVSGDGARLEVTLDHPARRIRG